MDLDPTHFGMRGVLNVGFLVQATRADDGRIRVREAIELRVNDGNERPSHVSSFLDLDFTNLLFTIGFGPLEMPILNFVV